MNSSTVKFPAKHIYACFRQDGTVKVQMFVTPNAAMCHIRHYSATLIELRHITASNPDGIVLAQAK